MDGITTLTIEPGAEVRFNRNLKLEIGASSGDPGALVAHGTEADPIVFTSNDAAPAPGNWYGVRFLNTTDDGSTELDHCVVEYAGYGNQGALYVYQSGPTVQNTIVRDSSTYGAYVSSGSPTISGSEILNCATKGVYVSSGSPLITGNTFNGSGEYDLYYTGTPGGSVSSNLINNGLYLSSGIIDGINGNTFNYNNAFPVRLSPDNVGGFFSDNTVQNLNSESYLEVNSGTLAKDSVWPGNVGYHILGNVTIKGVDGADGITTLTIEPGAEVRFNRNLKLEIGASSGDPGALVAQGTEADPIVFTSNDAAPAPGNWYGVRFLNTTDDGSTALDYCVVEYAGYASQGALYVYQSGPSVQNTIVRDSGSYGAYISSGAPTITGCSFTGNGNYDVYYTSPNGGQLNGNSIQNGIYLINGSLDSITGNTIAWNDNYPVKIPVDFVGMFVTENTLNNVGAESNMEITGGTITKDAAWSNVIKYLVTGSVTVKGTDGVDGITTLTIEPGAKVRFNRNLKLEIGASSGDPGALIAQGTAAEPVVFTSSEATPAPGNWYGVRFLDTADDNTSILRNCIIDYGGYGNQGSVYCYNAKPAILYCKLRQSSHAGIYLSSAGCNDAQINCNDFQNNSYGVYTVSNALPIINSNNFLGNTTCGVYNAGTTTLNAENNWWGDAQGPGFSGDAVYGNVDVDPWLSEENDCSGGQVQNNPPYEPGSPTPANGAFRISLQTPVIFSWSGGDPDYDDTVAYDLFLGFAENSLSSEAIDLTAPAYDTSGLFEGTTYFWQVLAKDTGGLSTSGPVWHFTTEGDPPDLMVSNITSNPAGGVATGQSITFYATIENIGTGPLVDVVETELTVDGTSQGTDPINEILHAGESAESTFTWTYAGGYPTLEVISDSGNSVSETNEENNRFIFTLSEIVDMVPPELVSTIPANENYLQQVNSISVTLFDQKGTVEDASVMSTFSVTDGNSQQIAGSLSGDDDNFTFTPATVPLPDGAYQVSFTAADTYGNEADYVFFFTVDSQPPAKPNITGGTVQSGTIQPRPATNTVVQFIVELTGTREADTSVWVNGIQVVPSGSNEWSTQLSLMPGANAFEIWLVDLASNRGASDWVDLVVQSSNGTVFEYNDAGRMTRVTNFD